MGGKKNISEAPEGFRVGSPKSLSLKIKQRHSHGKQLSRSPRDSRRLRHLVTVVTTATEQQTLALNCARQLSFIESRSGHAARGGKGVCRDRPTCPRRSYFRS